FHLGQRKGVVLVVVLFLAAARARAALFAVIVVGLFFFFLGFLVLLVGRARGGFVDLARVGFLVLLLHLLDRRFFRQHRIEIEDLAQLHFAGVEGFGPLDDRVEGDRALAQAHDHRVAAGFDALCDGDLAFAAEQ